MEFSSDNSKDLEPMPMNYAMPGSGHLEQTLQSSKLAKHHMAANIFH